MSGFDPLNTKISYYGSGGKEVPTEEDWNVNYTDEYFSKYWKESDADVCKHQWVNVSLNFIVEACKHCGVDKPKV